MQRQEGIERGEGQISSVVPVERVESRILVIRGKRVIIDSDLAELYGTETKRLNEQVRRNRDRFPEDFAFQLTQSEKDEVVADCDHLANLRFSPHLPLAYTEHGAIMAANVLSSGRAIEMSVFVVRAFVRLRELLVANDAIVRKLEELEARVGAHDEAIQSIVAAIRQLMASPSETPRIGFHASDES